MLSETYPDLTGSHDLPWVIKEQAFGFRTQHVLLGRGGVGLHILLQMAKGLTCRLNTG